MNKQLIALAALISIAGAAGAQTTLGTGASAQSGVAIGTGAIQADVTGDLFGTGTPVNYRGGVAIGNGAFAAGKNIALGDGLQAMQDGVPNSYSLVIGGLNYNNGQVELRRIVGQARGIFGTDGMNVEQGQEFATNARDQAVMSSNAYTDYSVGVVATVADNAYSLAGTANNRANSA
jgi:hypothetical protein